MSVSFPDQAMRKKFPMEYQQRLLSEQRRKKTAMFVQDVFMSDRFRVYTSPDMIGIELGGALKNVIALAAGILDGMGLGDNTKSCFDDTWNC